MYRLEAWEQKNWGTTNCEVAERILHHWRLPSDAIVSIRHHYRPEHRHNPIIHLLNLAAASADDRLFGLPSEKKNLERHAGKFRKSRAERAEILARERTRPAHVSTVARGGGLAPSERALDGGLTSAATPPTRGKPRRCRARATSPAVGEA